MSGTRHTIGSRLWRAGKIAGKICLLAGAFILLYPGQRLALWRGSPWAGRLPMLFHRLALACLGVKITVEGTPSSERPLLLAANHVSWLDITLLGSLLPLSFIAKSEVAGWPVFGLFARLQRTIFIERQRRQATGTATQEIGQRLSAGDCLVLFAEGTSSDGRQILNFRSALLGGARAALMSGGHHPAITVQPVAMTYGGYRGLPIIRARLPTYAWYGDMALASHLLNVLEDGAVDVTISFGTAISFTLADDRKDIARRLEAATRTMFYRAQQGRSA